MRLSSAAYELPDYRLAPVVVLFGHLAEEYCTAMHFSTIEMIYLAISFLVTIAALLTLFFPPYTRLGKRDREYVRAVIQLEIDKRFSDFTILDILDELHNRGAFDPVPHQEGPERS